MFISKIQDKIGVFCLLFAIGFAFFIISPALRSSYINAGDTFWHYSNEISLVRSIEDGQGIFSCFPKGLGTPVLSFYQPLLYLAVAMIHIVSFKLISVYFIHNFLVAVLFSLFPLSVFYFVRSFGFSKLEAGIASIFALFPVSGCGHTVEACLSLGVHTQLIGTVLLPVVLGSLHRLVFGQNQKTAWIVFNVSVASLILGHAVYTLLTAYVIPLYLLLFSIWYGFRKFFVVIKKLILAAIIVFLLTAFWLIPFIAQNNEYRYISSLERSGSAIFHSLTVKDFVQTLFSGELLDNTKKDSVLLEQEGRDKGLRWSDNAAFNRYYIFTIFSITGFLFFLLKARRFRDFYLVFLFLFGIFLFLGADDIRWLKFLPFHSEFQNIRAILIIEMLCAVFSGLICVKIIDVSMQIWRRYFQPMVYRSASVLLITFLIVILLIPLIERYKTARSLIASHSKAKPEELAKLFSDIKLKDNRIFFNEDSIYKSFADCFSLNNVTGLDFFVGNNLALLIDDIRDRIPESPELLSMLGIKYLLFEGGFNAQMQSLPYQKILSGDYFDLYEITENYPFFFVPQKKPVFVYCSKSSWYYLNRIWLRSYLKHGDTIAQMIKFTDSVPIYPDTISSLLLLNFPETNDTRERYFQTFQDFLKNGGVIYSNKPLWALPVTLITPSDASTGALLLDAKENFQELNFKEIKTRWFSHSLEYISTAPQYIIAKTIFYRMWNALSSDTQKLQTFSVSPGFTGIFVEKPEDVIKLIYNSSKLHRSLFIAGVMLIIALTLFLRKRKFMLDRIDLDAKIVQNPKIYYTFVLISGIAFFYLCGIYYQQRFETKTALIYPLNHQKNLSPFEVTFQWNTLSTGERYIFQLSENEDFTRLIASAQDRDKNFILCRDLAESRRYYWRVKIAGKPKWSAVFSFDTSKF